MKLIRHFSDLIDDEYYACYECNGNSKYVYVGQYHNDIDHFRLIGHLTTFEDVCLNEYWNVYDDFEYISAEQCIFHLNEVEAMIQFEMET